MVKSLEDFLDFAAIDSSIHSEPGIITLTARHLSTAGDGSKNFNFEWNYSGTRKDSYKHPVTLDNKETLEEQFKTLLEYASNNLYKSGLYADIKKQSLILKPQTFKAEEAADILNSLGTITSISEITQNGRQANRAFGTNAIYIIGIKKHLNEHDILVRIKSYYAKK